MSGYTGPGGVRGVRQGQGKPCQDTPGRGGVRGVRQGQGQGKPGTGYCGKNWRQGTTNFYLKRDFEVFETG